MATDDTDRLCAGSGLREQIQSSANTLPMLLEQNGKIRHFRQRSVVTHRHIIVLAHLSKSNSRTFQGH